MEDALTFAVRQIVREEVARAMEEHRTTLTAESAPPSPPAQERQPRTKSSPRLLFVDEVAEILRKSPAQIRWMLHKGTAPRHAKIGGRVVFKHEDIVKFVDDALTPPDEGH